MAILGVDLGGTNVRVGKIVVTTIVNKLSQAISNQGSRNQVLDEIYVLLDKLMGADIEGIGVGVPSVVDVKKGIVYDVQNIPSWQEVPLKELLQARYHVPVLVNNDANCFAVGEKHFGGGKPFADMVGLICGTGLGAGLILNNRLYSGRNCGAGEFGMIPYRDGILENYCCGQYFKRIGSESGEQLFARAAAGDERAKGVFAEFGSHVGEAIKIILYACDPEAIILGGSVSRAWPYFSRSMWESIRGFAYSRSLMDLAITCSQLQDSAIFGAAALLLDAKNDSAA